MSSETVSKSFLNIIAKPSCTCRKASVFSVSSVVKIDLTSFSFLTVTAVPFVFIDWRIPYTRQPL